MTSALVTAGIAAVLLVGAASLLSDAHAQSFRDRDIQERIAQIEIRLADAREDLDMLEDTDGLTIHQERQAAQLEAKISRMTDRIAELESRLGKSLTQAEDLQERIDRLHARIADATARLDATPAHLENRTAKLSAQIERMQDRASELEARLAEVLAKEAERDAEEPEPEMPEPEAPVARIYVSPHLYAVPPDEAGQGIPAPEASGAACNHLAAAISDTSFLSFDIAPGGISEPAEIRIFNHGTYPITALSLSAQTWKEFTGEFESESPVFDPLDGYITQWKHASEPDDAYRDLAPGFRIPLDIGPSIAPGESADLDLRISYAGVADLPAGNADQSISFSISCTRPG